MTSHSTDLTQPVHSYADAIREVVRVQSPVSSQDDGELDMIYVDIIRPAGTANGLKVPTIILPSGYFGGWGRTRASQVKPPPGKPIDFFPHFYDNYFVPRGYAVALVDVAGTRGSTGCPDIIGPAEVDGTGAVVEWLAGEGLAVDLTGAEVSADWSTGRVGVIGKSWDGTIPNAMATRDIKGLVTIVPIAAVSELHEDFWYNGARYGGSPMEFSDGHRATPEEQVTKVRNLFRTEQERPEPDTEFWDGRSALRHAANVTASVFIAHGRYDYNVTPNQYARWWEALSAHDVPRKMWLSLTGHEDPFDFRRDEWIGTLHRWFDYWLYQIDNGIMDEPLVDVEHRPGEWVTYDAWPAPDAEPARLWLGADAHGAGALSPQPASAAPPPMTFQASYHPIAELAAEPEKPRDFRLAFVSPALTEEVRISGRASIDLVTRIRGADATLTAMLVDYGRTERLNWEVGGGLQDLETIAYIGQGTDADDGGYRDVALRTHVTDFEVVTRGWANASFVLGEAPGDESRWHELSWELSPNDHVFAPGHRIGVIVGGADADMLWQLEQEATLHVDLSSTVVQLPVVGGADTLRAALGGTTE